MSSTTRIVVVLVAAMASTADTSAHFKMLSPTPWVVTNDLGDPQKVGPCGGDPKGQNDAILSKEITKVAGGSKLHLKIQETIFHSGHYRVALAVNSPSELPLDPKATTMVNGRGQTVSVSGEIMNPVAPPVLADGLWPHQAKPDAPFETEVTIPNINCRACTLQVIQFMEQHGVNNPGNFTYHHCAVLRVTADPAKPVDAAWAKER